MMGTRKRLTNGDEHDALPWKGWRRLLIWRPGERHRIKAKFWRRVRRDEKVEARREAGE